MILYFISSAKNRRTSYVTNGAQLSRFILRPNRAYNATLSCSISSCSWLSWFWRLSTSSSICDVDSVKSSCTSDTGRERNESPILYLAGFNLDRTHWGSLVLAYGTFSSSSASSSSFDTSSRSSLSFYGTLNTLRYTYSAACWAYLLSLQLIFYAGFFPMKTTKTIDLFLVFTTYFDLVLSDRLFIFSCELSHISVLVILMIYSKDLDRPCDGSTWFWLVH